MAALLTARLQSIVCTLAILMFKQLGLFKNLAPFDSTKAKKCTTP